MSDHPHEVSERGVGDESAKPARFVDLLSNTGAVTQQTRPFSPLPSVFPLDGVVAVETLAPTTPSEDTTNEASASSSDSDSGGSGSSSEDGSSNLLPQPTFFNPKKSKPTKSVKNDPYTSGLVEKESKKNVGAIEAAFKSVEVKALETFKRDSSPPDQQNRKVKGDHYGDKDKETARGGAGGVGGAFGLAGLGAAFPSRRSTGAQLLTKQQMTKELSELGITTEVGTRTGLHLSKNGGAVVVEEEAAFRVRRLSAACVQTFRKKSKGVLKQFEHSADNMLRSQEIANIEGVVSASSALKTSGVLACSSTGELFARRLDVLTDACNAWRDARSKVARLMHQAKARKLQIEALNKKLATMHDVLRKDTDAVESASIAEQKIAAVKRPLVMGLIREVCYDLKDIKDMAASAEWALLE